MSDVKSVVRGQRQRTALLAFTAPLCFLYPAATSAECNGNFISAGGRKMCVGSMNNDQAGQARYRMNSYSQSEQAQEAQRVEQVQRTYKQETGQRLRSLEIQAEKNVQDGIRDPNVSMDEFQDRLEQRSAIWDAQRENNYR